MQFGIIEITSVSGTMSQCYINFSALTTIKNQVLKTMYIAIKMTSKLGIYKPQILSMR